MPTYQRSPGNCELCGKRILAQPVGRYQAKRYCSVECWDWVMRIEAELGVAGHRRWHTAAGPTNPPKPRRQPRRPTRARKSGRR